MKVTQYKRKVSISNAVWSTTNGGTWTLTTTGNHLLTVGDTFSFVDPYSPTNINVTCTTGTTGTTIVFLDANSKIKFPTDLFFTTFPQAFTGDTVIETVKSNVRTFQATVTTTSGNGACVANLLVSNDGVAWVTANALSVVSAASPATISYTLTAPWLYSKVNVTSITGTGAVLKITSCGLQ